MITSFPLAMFPIFPTGFLLLRNLLLIIHGNVRTAKSVPMHLLQQYQAFRIFCEHFMQSTEMGKNGVVVVVKSDIFHQ